MADTTPVHGFPFPEPADPNNVPADIQALAEAIEAKVATFSVEDPRPAAGVPGRWHYSGTVLSYDNGAAWVTVAGTYPPFFSVYRTATAQLLPRNVLTKLTGFTVAQNDGAAFNAGTSRFTCPANWGGVWDLHACVHWDGPQPNPHLVEFYKNGATRIHVQTDASGAGFSTTGLIQNGSRRIRLVEGDYIELRGRQEDGTTDDPRPVFTPEWSGTWLRP